MKVTLLQHLSSQPSQLSHELPPPPAFDAVVLFETVFGSIVCCVEPAAVLSRVRMTGADPSKGFELASHVEP